MRESNPSRARRRQEKGVTDDLERNQDLRIRNACYPQAASLDSRSMLMIRLQRTGRSNLATYRVVVAEKARPVKGKFLAILGHYLPQQNPPVFKVDEAVVTEWIKKGAQPSDTAARLFKKAGMKDMDKYMQRYTKKKPKGEEPAAEAPAAPAPAAAAPAEAKPEVKAEPAAEEAPKKEGEAAEEAPKAGETPKAEEPKKEETPPAEAPAAA